MSEIGDKFGKLTIVSFAKRDKRKICICKCDCGKEISYREDLLKEGRRKSCGCIRSPNRSDYLINLQKRLLKSSSRVGQCLEWNGRRTYNGYGVLTIRKEGKKNGKKIGTNAHRASYLAWIGPIKRGLLVLHKCDNRCCIEPSHLFLGTHADNMNDMKLKMRQYRPEGELHGQSKFSDSDILKIREEYATGSISQAKLAKKYAMSLTSAHNIVTRKSWKHI